jgi:hypothetical protein
MTKGGMMIGKWIIAALVCVSEIIRFLINSLLAGFWPHEVNHDDD